MLLKIKKLRFIKSILKNPRSLKLRATHKKMNIAMMRMIVLVMVML